MRWLAPALLASAGCSAQPVWQRALDGHTAELLERKASGVLLACEPEDAEVLVDGVPQGTCQDLTPPHQIEMGEQSHSLEVHRPGYAPYRADLFAGNARTRLTVRLSPLN